MIAKEEKMNIFVATISGLRKKPFLLKDQSKVQDLIVEEKSEKFRRLPLD